MFEQALKTAPEGAWFGPLPSRYGYHVVWVHERRAGVVPPFEEIRPLVEQRFLHKVADEWLALRLQQLRAEFDIVVPEPSPVTGRSAGARWSLRLLLAAPRSSGPRRSPPTSSPPRSSR